MTASANNVRPAIARIWRGRTTAAKAENTRPTSTSTASGRWKRKRSAVQKLREDRAEETEFVTISYWESVEASRVSPATIRGASIICRATPSS